MWTRQLETLDDLTAAVEGSASRPAVIFKHSRTCGTSMQAYDEVSTLLAGPGLPADVYLVPVQSSRAVSNAVESQFGIRHESPQILLLQDGSVVWHASHFRVTASAIQRAVAQLSPVAR
jgi:bacillithiol system protein YtxJ